MLWVFYTVACWPLPRACAALSPEAAPCRIPILGPWFHPAHHRYNIRRIRTRCVGNEQRGSARRATTYHRAQGLLGQCARYLEAHNISILSVTSSLQNRSHCIWLHWIVPSMQQMNECARLVTTMNHGIRRSQTSCNSALVCRADVQASEKASSGVNDVHAVVHFATSHVRKPYPARSSPARHTDLKSDMIFSCSDAKCSCLPRFELLCAKRRSWSAQAGGPRGWRNVDRC